MGVGYGESRGSASRNLRPIATHRTLAHRVGDLLAVAILGHARKCVLPTIGGANRRGFHRFPVGEQLHGNRLWAQSVAVVVIVPHLGYAYVERLGNVRVGDREMSALFALGFGIARGHGRLRQGVLNLLPVLVSGHDDGFLPVLVCPDGVCAHTAIRALQIQVERLKSLAILVVGIFPMLGEREGCGANLVSVDDAQLGRGLPRIGQRGVLFWRGDLFYGVGNLLAIIAVLEVRAYVPRPPLVRGYGVRIHHLAIGKKLYLNALWPHAVTVVAVVPVLREREVHGLKLIGYVVAVIARAVARNWLLLHRIGNGVAVVVRRGPAYEAVAPVAQLRRLRIHVVAVVVLHALAVGQQVDLDRLGTLAELVVLVIPRLLAVHGAGWVVGRIVGDIPVHLYVEDVGHKVIVRKNRAPAGVGKVAGRQLLGLVYHTLFKIFQVGQLLDVGDPQYRGYGLGGDAYVAAERVERHRRVNEAVGKVLHDEADDLAGELGTLVVHGDARRVLAVHHREAPVVFLGDPLHGQLGNLDAKECLGQLPNQAEVQTQRHLTQDGYWILAPLYGIDHGKLVVQHATQVYARRACQALCRVERAFLRLAHKHQPGRVGHVLVVHANADPALDDVNLHDGLVGDGEGLRVIILFGVIAYLVLRVVGTLVARQYRYIGLHVVNDLVRRGIALVRILAVVDDARGIGVKAKLLHQFGREVFQRAGPQRALQTCQAFLGRALHIRGQAGIEAIRLELVQPVSIGGIILPGKAFHLVHY